MSMSFPALPAPGSLGVSAWRPIDREVLLTDTQKRKIVLLSDNPKVIWENKLKGGTFIVSEPKSVTDIQMLEQQRDTINSKCPNLAQVIDRTHSEGQPSLKSLAIRATDLEKVSKHERERDRYKHAFAEAQILQQVEGHPQHVERKEPLRFAPPAAPPAQVPFDKSILIPIENIEGMTDVEKTRRLRRVAEWMETFKETDGLGSKRINYVHKLRPYGKCLHEGNFAYYSNLISINALKTNPQQYVFKFSSTIHNNEGFSGPTYDLFTEEQIDHFLLENPKPQPKPPTPPNPAYNYPIPVARHQPPYIEEEEGRCRRCCNEILPNLAVVVAAVAFGIIIDKLDLHPVKHIWHLYYSRR